MPDEQVYAYEFRIWPHHRSTTRGGRVDSPEFEVVHRSIGYYHDYLTESQFGLLRAALERNGWELHEVSRWIENRETVL